jgi:drug/metabolite transporter (DMT)-like permease
VPASLAALIVYVYPALVAVLSLRFGRRLEGRQAWFALGMSSTGVALAVGGISPGTVPPLADLVLAGASPVIYACWIILAARLGGERPADQAQADEGVGTPTSIPPGDAAPTPEATSPAPAAALMLTATAAMYLALMVTVGRPITPGSIPGSAWFGILGVAVFATAVALQGFYAGARRIGAARASLVSTVEPIYTICLATLLLGESLTPIQVLGGALVIAGVLLAELGQVRGDSTRP